MTGISISIGADFSAINEVFIALERAPSDMTDVFDEIGLMLVESTQDRFDEGVDPDGVAWEPSQRALANGDKTLYDRGHLHDSITYIPSSDSLEVGSNMIYAAIHQLGGEAGRNHSVVLPARPYLGISDDDNDAIHDILGDWLGETIDRAS